MPAYKRLAEGTLRDLESGASIPPDPDNRHFRAYLEWVNAGNSPEPVESLAEARTRRTLAVNDAAGAIILARLPAWKQANLTARAVELTDVQLSRALTAEEAQERDAILAAWAWIKAVRAASDTAVDAVAAAASVADVDAVTPAWPAS